MNDRPRTYPDETRQAALRMWDQDGLTARQIAARLSVPVGSVKWWLDSRQTSAIPKVKRTRTKSGSGVIAPPAYRYGYRWVSGIAV